LTVNIVGVCVAHLAADGRLGEVAVTAAKSSPSTSSSRRASAAAAAGRLRPVLGHVDHQVGHVLAREAAVHVQLEHTESHTKKWFLLLIILLFKFPF
jgi:hypothetical protein